MIISESDLLMFLQSEGDRVALKLPSFGSETIKDPDLSSRLVRSDANFCETFPSTMADMLSKASAVFSNLENVFNRRLVVPMLVRTKENGKAE